MKRILALLILIETLATAARAEVAVADAGAWLRSGALAAARPAQTTMAVSVVLIGVAPRAGL